MLSAMDAVATPSELAELMNAKGGALCERLQIHFVEVSAQRVVATMPVEGNTQPYGLLHGGASAALAESVGSVQAVVAAGPGRAAVGVSITATHHRAVTSGTVTAVGSVLAAGRTMATILIEITDDEDRRVCTSTLVCQLRDAPPARTS